MHFLMLGPPAAMSLVESQAEYDLIGKFWMGPVLAICL